jgi:hypothetical protein
MGLLTFYQSGLDPRECSLSLLSLFNPSFSKPWRRRREMRVRDDRAPRNPLPFLLIIGAGGW